MGRIITDLPNTESPSIDYPHGRIKDNPGDGSGTKMNEEAFGDMFVFFARMLSGASITANGLPDNGTNGFQYYDAFKKLAFDTGTKTNMTLVNGFGSSSNLPAYRRDSMGTITLSGVVIAPGGQDTFFTLPTGFRPLTEKSYVLGGGFPGFDTSVLIVSASGLCRLFTFAGGQMSNGDRAYINVTFNIHD